MTKQKLRQAGKNLIDLTTGAYHFGVGKIAESSERFFSTMTGLEADLSVAKKHYDAVPQTGYGLIGICATGLSMATLVAGTAAYTVYSCLDTICSH